MLLRVLPAVYEKQPQPIHRHLAELLALMSQLEQTEQYHLLRLLHAAAKKRDVEVGSELRLLDKHCVCSALCDGPHSQRDSWII